MMTMTWKDGREGEKELKMEMDAENKGRKTRNTNIGREKSGCV